jgi:hypothetical protein
MTDTADPEDILNEDFYVQAGLILTGLDNVHTYADRNTFPDAKLVVFATLLHTRATLLVATQLKEVIDHLREFKA